MRILHTSDWHLGKYLEDYSRIEEQEKFIDELVNIVNENEIDLVLIAGDIYDNSNPPAKAETLFYRAIKRLSNNGERIVLIIAGNHDNPDRLVSSKPLAREHGVILLGTPKSKVEPGEVGQHKIVDGGEGFIELEINNEKAVILTLPYPSEQRLNEVFQGVIDEEGMQKNYSERVSQIFSELSGKYREDTINLCVSHLFVMGGETTDSERPIQIGGGLTVHGNALPEKAQYIALGHLHKSQRVRGTSLKAYYSGSPIQYSKSEVGQEKYVYIIDVKAGQEPNIEKKNLNILKPVEVWRVKGIDEALEKCLDNEDRKVWVYLEIITDKLITQSQIKELKGIKPDILSISPIIENIEEDKEDSHDLREKSIFELFKGHYLNERKIEPSEELMAIFAEIITEEGDEAETENA
ncbi:Exodeoxyribonuclease I subunit D [Proteiniborus ethanoligenes]|uniref:Nuclease SbcCD subunit D n=1 Tax=Proteiniborus ethanoligenes TaxID=415015 RepID=A0A1H3RTZ6_9FIRM|nr:exonuclease SbcCD subunit D [Proteiniborus ethanoligenes]TAH64039.1 MAG: exonuclease SbcCD subunit D [Gottschalkiaceae bacterium]SDZ28795.1 Exodeoxyribonuclease I subunit D [Proteiniborus ethanoligenes]